MDTLCIWDFHGTIEIGTIFILTEIANTLLRENGSDKQYTPAEFATIPSFSWNTFFQNHFSNLGPDIVTAIAQNAYNEDKFGYLLEKYSQANEGALHVLQHVKSNGGKNVVVSHSRQDKLGFYIDHIGAGQYVDEYYGVDDGSISSREDVVQRKTSVIRGIHDRHKHLHCLAIGDAEMDFRAAMLAGVKKFFWLIHVNNKGAKQQRFKDVPSEKLRFILRLEELLLYI